MTIKELREFLIALAEKKPNADESEVRIQFKDDECDCILSESAFDVAYEPQFSNPESEKVLAIKGFKNDR